MDGESQVNRFAPGQRVAVTQQVQHRRWSARVEGVVVSHELKKTGSWFAHSKDDRLWLDRLTIRKDDGELYVCNLDPYTRIEPVASSDAVPQDAGTTAADPATAAGSRPSTAAVTGEPRGPGAEGTA
jgi:hypothetical protein